MRLFFVLMSRFLLGVTLCVCVSAAARVCIPLRVLLVVVACEYQASESRVVKTKDELQSMLSLPVRRKTTMYTLAAHIMSQLAPSLVSREL